MNEKDNFNYLYDKTGRVGDKMDPKIADDAPFPKHLRCLFYSVLRVTLALAAIAFCLVSSSIIIQFLATRTGPVALLCVWSGFDSHCGSVA